MPPPPKPHPEKRRAKRKQGATADTQVAVGDNFRTPGGNMVAATPDTSVKIQAPTPAAAFYTVRAMAAEDSPDQRCQLEKALLQLANHLREDPTLPAHPDTPDEPWDLALREDISVTLPRKHCAFKQCVWVGASDAELYEHLIASHSNQLYRCADMMPLGHFIKDRVWSVYNEAIAVVARRGAPLATGSIDRRSMKNFVGAFDGEGIQSLVCFSCTRRFPRVATWRKNDIDWITVLNNVDMRIGQRH